MSMHICNMRKKEKWEKIKTYISGRHKLTDSFTCGGCYRTFETICCLHIHCMTHNVGGSYYFDHVTNTAFPRHDSICSSTQLDLDNFGGVSDTDRILKCRARSINKRSASDVTDPDVSADVDQVVSVVKVRNVTKSKDGSILFEMDEKDAYLSEKTAQKVVEEMNKLGEEVGNASELEIHVSVHTENDQQLGSDIVTDLVVHEHKQTVSSVVPIEHPNELVNKQVTVDRTVCQMNVSDKTNELISCSGSHTTDKDGAKVTVSDPCISENATESDETEVSGETCKHSRSTSNSEDAIEMDESEMNYETCRHDTSSNKKVIELEKADVADDKLDNTCDNKNIEKLDPMFINNATISNISGKSPENKSEKRPEKKSEVLTLVRSTRKRTLTPKMKESLMAKSLYANMDILGPENECVRNVDQPQVKKSQRTSKITGTNSKSFEADIYASEALLSLSETNGSSAKKATNKAKSDKNKQKSNEISEEGDRKTNTVKTPVSAATDQSELVNETKVNDDNNGNDEDISVTLNDSQSQRKLWKSAAKKPRMNGDDTKQISAETHQNDNESDNGENNNGEDDDHVERFIDNYDDDVDDDDGDDDYAPKIQSNITNSVPLNKRHDLVCPTCEKVGIHAMIRYHKQMHSSKKKHVCKECGKTLKTAACLRSHMKIHGEKKWKCDLCPAAFFRKAYLDTHKTNHTGVYPYICDLCGMKFKMSYILRRHVDCVHNNIRQFECDICQRGFFRASTRDQHRLRHFDASLKCSHCPKMFKADLDLRKHELTHTGEKLFFCPICNHGCAQIWPYYKHMWTIHQVTREEAKRVKIRNPNIKNMRKINQNSGTGDNTNVISPLSTGNSFSLNDEGKPVNNNTQCTSLSSIKSSEPNQMNLFTSVIDDNNFEAERNEISGTIYSRSSTDGTDAIVLDIGEGLDVNSTIVIQSDDIQTVNSAGYIVVDDVQVDGNIVVFSEFHESEIEQIVGNCDTAESSY